jgi:hypothetical protein
MSTDALLTMILAESIILFFVVYFFVKVLRGKKIK